MLHAKGRTQISIVEYLRRTKNILLFLTQTLRTIIVVLLLLTPVRYLVSILPTRSINPVFANLGEVPLTSMLNRLPWKSKRVHSLNRGMLKNVVCHWVIKTSFSKKILFSRSPLTLNLKVIHLLQIIRN
jgi:hypothetical protein